MKIKDKVLKELLDYGHTKGFSKGDIWKLKNVSEIVIDETLAEVGKVIGDEKKIVKSVCLGLVHPSQENQKEFTKWLQDTVNFHINQIEQKLGIK